MSIDKFNHPLACLELNMCRLNVFTSLVTGSLRVAKHRLIMLAHPRFDRYSQRHKMLTITILCRDNCLRKAVNHSQCSFLQVVI